MQVIKIENSNPPEYRILGQVTADVSGELREHLLAADPEAGRVIINLAEMTYIDTSGLGVLVGVRSHLKKRGAELVISNPQEKVMKIFRLTKLDLLFGLGK